MSNENQNKKAAEKTEDINQTKQDIQDTLN
ncbi:hypothetical protein [Staphylococcus aureus]|nr:hypothetical protein [Staphylococcus aureus]